MQQNDVTIDKDLIIALTDDYLNIYLVKLEEDVLEVIKLNGYITEGITGMSGCLNYTTILHNYTRSRVHPDDREMFLKICSRENLLAELKDKKMFQGTYRALEKGEATHFSFKFAKVSEEGEPIRAIAAFRNIEAIVAADQKKREELEDMKNIMAASAMGTWHITLLEGKEPRMSVDAKMKELLGISPDLNLSDEQTYQCWYSNIDNRDLDSVTNSVNAMIEGRRDENTYRWTHPALGERYVRCGGVAAPIPDGYILSGYHYDVTDQTLADIRKQKMLEDNIAANKAKTMFLQNMSHEIRTPLNAMFGFAQLLGLPDGSWTDEEKEQYNSYIFNSFNMLDMLIGDIIDIADSEHGNYRIDINDVTVNDVCRNAMMSVEYRKPGKVNMYFTSDLPDEHVIKSDGRRIQQVLINYLSNACKHTQQGEIHLHCSTAEHPGRLTFSVTDTGEGVPADKAEVIFNRFTKLNSFVQGSGLGLNICQLIAEKLGGEVFLDKSYSGGARFVFVIDDTVA